VDVRRPGQENISWPPYRPGRLVLPQPKPRAAPLASVPVLVNVLGRDVLAVAVEVLDGQVDGGVGVGSAAVPGGAATVEAQVLLLSFWIDIGHKVEVCP